jgi:hypothetical protein
MKSFFWLLFFALTTCVVAQTVPARQEVWLPSLEVSAEAVRPFTVASAAGAATDSVPSNIDSSASGASSSRTPPDQRDSSSLGKPAEPPQADTHIHWNTANRESLLSTGIMHVFNAWT